MINYYISSLKKIFSVAKKAFLVFIVFSAVIALFSYFINKDKIALAPSSPVDQIKQNRAEIYKVINDKKLNKTQQGKMTIMLYKSMVCGMIGEACTKNPSDADKNYQRSVFGFITKLIIIPYSNPPASGLAWVQSGLENAGFIPKTMAAEGIGFAAIKPFSEIWKIFRDVSYMLLVVVLIAIGFMVMFRAKLNPQTVMTVENALPKIVISLILITFSFAIAGFLIDLMYIFIGLIVSIFIKTPVDATTFKNEYMMASAGDLYRDVRLRFPWYSSIGTTVGNALSGILPISVLLMLRVIAGFLTVVITDFIVYRFTDGTASLLGIKDLDFATMGLGDVLSTFFKMNFTVWQFYIVFLLGTIFFLPLLMFLVIGFSVLLIMIRILLLLFTSYLKLILNIVIAPLLLLFEAVPGKNAFKYWIMNIISNLIPFPIIIFVFLLAYSIININSSGMTTRLPYLYGIDSNSFKVLIGFGLIFLIPDFIKTAREALGIKELPFNIGIGTFFGGVSAGVGGATGALGQVGSISLGLQAFGGEGGFAKLFNKFKRPPVDTLNATGSVKKQ